MGVNVFNTGDGSLNPKVIRANKAILSIGSSSSGKSGSTVLALGVTISYSRRVEDVPALTDDRILAMSEPIGQMTINTLVVKDKNTVEDILGRDKTGECEGFALSLSFPSDSCGIGGKSITMYGCVTSGVTFEAQGGRGYVASGVQVTFTGMEM